MIGRGNEGVIQVQGKNRRRGGIEQEALPLPLYGYGFRKDAKVCGRVGGVAIGCMCPASNQAVGLAWYSSCNFIICKTGSRAVHAHVDAACVGAG